MTAKGKILVTISSAPEAGSLAAARGESPHFLIANAVVETTDTRELSVIELRIVVPRQSAQARLRGMLEGETEIAITGMSPVVGLQ